ncbi:MAG TPA: integrin alpha [Planctomycetota bacterium]|jgi:hypothetical protein|nr:integrin alpha [Planctomycetota bacterium]
MKIFLPSITSTLLLPFVLASIAHAQVRVYQLSGEAPGLRLGSAVSAAGDVDLDGIPDYLVGGSPTVTGSYGQVLVISGRHGTVLHTLASNVADDGFGASVLGVGDLDLDGVPDAIVGSPTALCHDPLHLGAVRAYSGRTGSLLWLVRSPEGFGSTGFGKAIAEIGDLDGDGIPEIAVGPCTELGWMGNGTITSIRVLSGRDGSVVLAIGSMGGPPGVPSFGESIAGAGDVDGDGFPDILVGAPMAGYSHTEGTVYLRSGRDGAFMRAIPGLVPHSQFGAAIVPVGDLDHDGVLDFLVGAPRDDTMGPFAGSAWLLSGRFASTLHVFRGQAGEEFGSFVSSGVDLDGDGVPDLAVGAPTAGAGGTLSGAVRVYSGRNYALLDDISGQSPGESVGPNALVADMNGDGAGDLVVGAPGANDAGPDSGSARTYLLGQSPPTPYCTWKWNSQNCGSTQVFEGAPSLSVGEGLRVHVGGVINHSPGFLVWGLASAKLPFGGGTLCVHVLDHGPMQDSGGTPPPVIDCTGTLEFRFTASLLTAHGVGAGARVFCQFISRDAGFAPPNNVGLSEGLAFAVLP